MSESQTTDGNVTKGDNPQSPPVTTPPANQSVNSTPTIPDFSAITTQLAALPEQIAKSVKEAVGTPKPPASESKSVEEKPSEANPPVTNSTESKTSSGTPAKKSFVDWWFG